MNYIIIVIYLLKIIAIMSEKGLKKFEIDTSKLKATQVQVRKLKASIEKKNQVINNNLSVTK